MASSAAPAPSIHILTARPPTPPREASHDIDVSLRSVVLGRSQSLDPCHSLQTPPGAHSSISSVATASNPSSDRVRKRVEWSSHTDYKDPPDYRDSEWLGKSHLLSTPSSASSRPVKGILKPSPAPSLLASSQATELDGTVTQSNLIEMLDSSIKQLAGPDRDSKLDAYMMLARGLKTSNNLPDRVALQNKMSLFMQFIERDITAKNYNGALDSSLINHALTLLATFLHFQAIASTLTSDFGISIIDHSIRSFEDPAIPKDIIRHLMQVVAFQNFSAKVMAPDRVGRLVAALHKIENHVQGKSIVMSRLHIYKRLVKQARNSMLAHSDWLKDMFTDMLSTVKDIQAQAIILGTEAGFALRPDKLLFRKAADIFAATDDDELYIEFYIKRLQRMVKDKQTSPVVPRIWSVVILFLRCPFDRWEYYAPWLRLVQDAFNMTDGPTKQEANYAWNRYVCLSILDAKMSPKVINTLCKPLLSQLRRKASPKQKDDAMKLRRIVLGGVCSLYYYAFAQGDDKCPTEVTWDVAVQPVMAQLIDLDGKSDVPGDCMMHAAHMLAGLLDATTPRPPRDPDRVMDAAPLKPEELLPIDSKWVRRNCDKVFQAVEPILEKKFVDLANKDSLVYRLWQALIGSVAAASAKDIKVSEDTTKFLACSLSLLARVWFRGVDDDDGSVNAKFLSSVAHFVQVLVDGLGTLPFMDKKLLVSTTNRFEPVATPLQRSDKSERLWGGPQTPLQHLFSTLSSIPPGLGDDEKIANLFQSTFEPFFKSRNTKARFELARELIQLLPKNALSPYGPWLLAAEHMKSCVENSQTALSVITSGHEKLPGLQYRDLVTLLERGITSHPGLPADEWKCLFHLTSASVFQEFGDAGRALVIIEPLAKVMLEKLPSDSALPPATAARAMTTLFDVAILPRDRKALDTARLRLWGAPPATTKTGSPDPFDYLYKLANHQMEALFNTCTTLGFLQEWQAFAESVCMFFERCLAVSVVKTISKMQQGLCLWIQDEKDQLRLPDLIPLSHTLGRLWDRVCTELVAYRRLEKKDFDQIEPLLIVALKSRQVSIVNKAAGAWNALARDEENIECSDNFRSIISSLRSKLDLVVPGLGPLSNTDFDAQVSPLGGEDMESLILSATSNQGPKQVVAFASSATKQPILRKRQLEATSAAAHKSSKKQNISRLRHNDSQIQFAIIAPSSTPLDDSQHLTDRQREVRERQLENAALYSDIRSDGHARSDEAVAETGNATQTDNGDRDDLPRDITPVRNISFDDLVRSTPTPRRGQVLPVDDANDPPSSPPDPRPYPLLSEIQSRSRANSSLDNWEFSSPTGSPVARVHDVVQNPGSTSPAAKSEVLPTRSRTRPRKQQRFAARGRDSMIIPSSIPDDGQIFAGGRSKSSTIGLAVLDSPTTPPRSSRVSTSGKTWETLKSGVDDFGDARSSPDRPTPEHLKLNAADVRFEQGETATNKPVALSEGVENAAVDLVIELESRRYDPSASEGDDSAEETRKPDTALKRRISAPSKSPRGPTTRGESRRLASLITPAPAEATDQEAEGGSRRKRKRSVAIRHFENRDKRRRSEVEAVRPGHGLPKSFSPAPSSRTSIQPKVGTETRRSSRRRRELTSALSVSKMTGSPEDKETRGKRAETGADGGDTDEELMSQLVTETFAASRQSESQESVKRVTRRAAKQGSLKLTNPLDATTASPAEAELRERHSDEGKVAASILNTLRIGLEQLRKATLGRQAVYEVEDVLMDLKRELYDAEKRGRGGKQKRSGRSREAAL